MKARSWSVRILAGIALGASTASAQTPAPPPNFPTSQAPLLPNQPAAQVNGEVITLKEVDDYVALMKRALPPGKQVSDVEAKQLRLEAAMMLMDNRLVEQFLRQNAPPVTQQQADAWVARLEAALQKENQTLEAFMQERNLTRERLHRTALAVLQWEGYVNTRVTEAELKKHFEANKEFFNKISVRVSHIVIRMPANANPAERDKVRGQLLALKQQMVSRQIDFASAAKKYSQCSSAPSGGDLGYITTKGPLEENLTKAAFALKPGQISDVIPTEVGLHLITVTERKDGQPVNYEHVKDFVKASFSEELQMNVLEQQRKGAKINIYLEAPPGVQPIKP